MKPHKYFGIDDVLQKVANHFYFIKINFLCTQFLYFQFFIFQFCSEAIRNIENIFKKILAFTQRRIELLNCKSTSFIIIFLLAIS